MSPVSPHCECQVHFDSTPRRFVPMTDKAEYTERDYEKYAVTSEARSVAQSLRAGHGDSGDSLRAVFGTLYTCCEVAKPLVDLFSNLQGLKRIVDYVRSQSGGVGLCMSSNSWPLWPAQGRLENRISTWLTLDSDEHEQMNIIRRPNFIFRNTYCRCSDVAESDFPSPIAKTSPIPSPF